MIKISRDVELNLRPNQKQVQSLFQFITEQYFYPQLLKIRTYTKLYLC